MKFCMDTTRSLLTISGLSDDAIGYFDPEDGERVNFGPEDNYLLSNILDGSSPGGDLPAVGPVGEYIITGGEEDGQVGNISFEGFEDILFGVEADDDIMSALSLSPSESEARLTEQESLLDDVEDVEIMAF